ncbi:MAG: multidrug efflux SMR transporter [Candidatus Thermoplasmatota archaeon]|nr:multidrug efflux SMR transporter [Candidatus Thermoplasmatota archaeon]
MVYQEYYRVNQHPVSVNKWAYLLLAIVSEVIATASIKSTEEFTNLIPSVVVIIGYCAAFYFLSLTLDEIPLGIAYAIWSAVGIVGVALIAVIFHDQRLDAGAMIGMSLIIAGIVVMRLYSTMSLE